MSKFEQQVFNSTRNEYLPLYLYLAAGIGLSIAVFLYIYPK
jgi:hypothetical protein